MKQLLASNISSRYVALRISVFTIAVVLAACGCKKESKVRQSVALNAEFETVSTIVQQGPPEMDVINGKGQGTPMGQVSFIANAQFDTNNNLTGTITATSADGSKIMANISAQTPPNIDADGNITLHFNAVIIGGEGKFVGATGNFEGIAHESIYTNGGAASWNGTITY